MDISPFLFLGFSFSLFVFFPQKHGCVWFSSGAFFALCFSSFHGIERDSEVKIEGWEVDGGRRGGRGRVGWGKEGAKGGYGRMSGWMGFRSCPERLSESKVFLVVGFCTIAVPFGVC